MGCSSEPVILTASPTVGFLFNDSATTETYTLSLHDALPIWTSNLLSTGTVTFYLYAPGVSCATDGSGATYSETIASGTSTSAATVTDYTAALQARPHH